MGANCFRFAQFFHEIIIAVTAQMAENPILQGLMGYIHEKYSFQRLFVSFNNIKLRNIHIKYVCFISELCHLLQILYTTPPHKKRHWGGRNIAMHLEFRESKNMYISHASKLWTPVLSTQERNTRVNSICLIIFSASTRREWLSTNPRAEANLVCYDLFYFLTWLI